jgi:hypothetical protein
VSEEPCSIPVRDKRLLYHPKCPDRLWVPRIFLLSGYQGLFFAGIDVDHLPSSSVKVKSEWKLYLQPPTRLHGVHGRKILRFVFLNCSVI